MAPQTIFNPQPVTLQGKIVRLEPLTLDHAAGVLAAGAAESIWQFFAVSAPTNLEQAREWIAGRLGGQAAGQRLPFAVICLADGKFAGSTGYAAISRPNRTLDLASWYGVEYQRTGVNTECKYLLLRHAFEELGALRVGLNVDLENTRSRRAVERIGGTQEGILRKHRIRRDGTRRDSVVFSFIDDEWPSVKANLARLMDRPIGNSAMQQGKQGDAV
ncbi:MAG TPA: GNAT family protein [Dehalococcoidia bacterium]|nr:GNAT family protein [Dehalococcoidia bacterium]